MEINFENSFHSGNKLVHFIPASYRQFPNWKFQFNEEHVENFD